MEASAEALTRVTCSYLLYQEEDLPKLIQNVVDKRENCETEFVEALPLFIHVLSPDDVRSFLIPFIRNWIPFGDKTVVYRFTSLLPFFMPPHSSVLVFFDLLFPICELIRQSAMFIEEPIMKMCECVQNVFDKEFIETIFLPALDQLYIRTSTDSQGLAIRMQSFFAKTMNQNWVDRISDRVYSLATHSSTFVRTRVLEALTKLIPVVENRKEMMEAVLVPCFKHSDFKVRAAAVAAASEIGIFFFSIDGYSQMVLEMANDLSWAVRFAFVQNFDALLEAAVEKRAFLKPILDLSKDSVGTIKALAISALARTVDIFATDELEQLNIAAVFDAGMRAHQEDIRVATIELWTQLLRHHRDGKFQTKLRGTLNLIAAVPIESTTYAIMYNVVPLIPREFVSDTTLRAGLKTLFSAVEPRWKVSGLKTLSLYVSIADLKDFAAGEYETVLGMFRDPAFCVRCAAGELFTDYTNTFGWGWFDTHAKTVLLDAIFEGNDLIKMSIMRTIAAMLAISPPAEHRELLVGMIDRLSDSPSASVREHAAYCRSHIHCLL